MMLNRDAGSDVLGVEGEVCVQRVCERVHMAGEYNNNSRNFANENKLDKVVTVVTLRSGRMERLTRCHQTSYIVPSPFDRSYNSATCQYPPSVHRGTSKGPVAPSAPPRESRRGSTFARVAVGEICNPAARMVHQRAYR